MTSPSAQLLLLLFGVVGVLAISVGAADSTPTTEACRQAIGTMTGCLPYTTGKETKPTSDCCTVVSTTVQKNKECLCSFIELVRQGNPAVTSLGVKEAKLVELPSACGLKNVSVTKCANLSPTSSPIASGNSTTGDAGHKLHTTLRLEALVIVAMLAFLLPFRRL